MGVARIFEHTVRVESKTIDGNDTYFIHGEGVAGLHRLCAAHKLKASDLVEGSFHILRETVLKEQKGDDFMREYICTAIRNAALGKDASISR